MLPHILTSPEYNCTSSDAAAASGDGSARTLSAVPEVEWSEWMPFFDAVEQAPRLPGVYMVRRVGAPDIVYIGSAGERSSNGRRAPKGLWGRLSVYASGKAAVSGLGEAVLDRALADPDFVRARLAEAEAGEARRTKDLARLAMEWVGIEVRWTTSPS